MLLSLRSKTTELIVKEFGVNITMGASNVSFGLPDRSAVNTAFMSMAIQAGLTCPITNPLDPDLAIDGTGRRPGDGKRRMG